MPSPLLGIGLATANLPAAIDAGTKAGTAKFNAEQTQRANRKLANKKSKFMDFQLAQAGRAEAISAATHDDQLALTQQQLKATTNKLLRSDTYQALNNFFDSGDPRSINQFFIDNRENPTVQNMYGNIARIDIINPQSPEDRKLLRAAGMDDKELDALDGAADGKIDWDKLQKRYVKAIGANGQTQITDMLRIASATGYQRYADTQALDRMKLLADINKAQTPGSNSTADMKNAAALGAAKERIATGKGTAEDLALVDLLKKTPPKPPSKSSLVKDAEALAAARIDRDDGDGQVSPINQAVLDFAATKRGGAKAGRVAIAETARTEWIQRGFDKLSQKELQATPDAHKLINQIELAHGLSEAQKKELLELNALVTLSSEAGQLSGSQTGLWDRLTNDIGKYVSSEVGDKQARASYAAFINQFRHNLFGSALTEGELKAFKEAHGGLGEKIGPVLSGLRAALTQVRSKLQTISDLNDPAVVQMRMGKSPAELKAVIANVDKRIALYDKVSSGLPVEEARKEVFGTAEKTVTGSKPTKATPPQTVEEVSAFLSGGN